MVILDADSISEPYCITKFHSKLQIQDGRHKKAQNLQNVTIVKQRIT